MKKTTNIITKKLSAVYLNSKSNIQYLTNFHGSNGVILLTKKRLYLFTDQRYLAEAKKNCHLPRLIKSKLRTEVFHCSAAQLLSCSLKVIDMGKTFSEKLTDILKKERIKNLGFEENHLTYHQYKWLQTVVKPIRKKLAPTKNLIENIRSLKSNKEIANIIKAQRIAERVLAEIKNHLTIGVKESELAWKIEYLGRFYGAEAVSFPPLVCFGKNSAVPHHEPNHTPLQKGDIVLLDFGFKYNGYCSDMTRTFFTQPPTNQQIKVYKTLLNAQKEAIKQIKPGQTGAIADSFGRNVIKNASFGDYFTHSLGHGVGLDIHELPNLSPKFKQKLDVPLQKNMVITIEPGIYLEDKFGIRIEDMIVIGAKHNKNLTNAPKRLEDAIIKL